jgi:hypothetical protein
MKSTTFMLFAALGALVGGCSGSGGAAIPSDPSRGADGGPVTTPPGTTDPPGATDGGTAGDGGTGIVNIHVHANTKPFPHNDGFAGQTPRDEYMGIRGLLLYLTKDDPNPMLVFDNGSFVEARLNDGDDTVVAKVPASKLKAGNYTFARTLVTHARYNVNATVHASGFSTPGEYENLLVLSDNTTVNNRKWMSGDLETTFRGGGQTYGPTDLKQQLPRWETGGITFEVVNGQASYFYPVALRVEPSITTDVDVTFDVNMTDCFRWEDQSGFGYQSGVWDVELTGYEPVKQFSANAFTLTVAAAK